MPATTRSGYCVRVVGGVSNHHVAPGLEVDHRREDQAAVGMVQTDGLDTPAVLVVPGDGGIGGAQINAAADVHDDTSNG